MRANHAVSYRMSRVDRYRGRGVLAALTLLASAACSEATTEQAGAPVRVVIEPARLNLSVDEVAPLIPGAVDAKLRSVRATFSWSSAHPDIATVSSTGLVTGVGIGTTTVTATTGTLTATVPIIVHPVSLSILPQEMVMNAGGVDRFTARLVGVNGRLLTLPIDWSSANPAIATVGKTDGVVSAIAAGSTTVTAVAGRSRATATVTVEPDSHLAQWASGALASTEYTNNEWSAAQATGAPNVTGCGDDVRAWASAEPSLDWLEVTYAQPVIPTKIHIYVNWAVGSIAKVEVKDIGGSYHVVYSATPTELACPSVLAINVTNVTAKVGAVRITVDQRARGDWTEIDAVRLVGRR